MTNLYEDRKLSDGFPDLEKKGLKYYQQQQESTTRLQEIFECLERLIRIDQGLKTVCVIGCGPNPNSVRELITMGYDAVGIEPVEGSAKAAISSIGDDSRIRIGSSENLPLPDNSQRVVLFENVLEHVDSSIKSLTEAFRVLDPGGVAFVYTINRYRLSLTGKNNEFNVRFYNWFPDLVKESYVFRHLHYDPRLANYTPRPAVHWYSYSDLCSLGRSAGFSQFYSFIDLVDINSPSIRKHWLSRYFLNKIRYNPWLRALALLQYGNSIFLLKKRNTIYPSSSGSVS